MKPWTNGRASSVNPNNYASSNSRTICPQSSLHNVLWRSRVKVLYFRTYPSLDTTGHIHGRPATRMDTSVQDVHVHNTYIYINTFPLRYIYTCVRGHTQKSFVLKRSYNSLKMVGILVISSATRVFMRVSGGHHFLDHLAEWWASYENKWAS